MAISLTSSYQKVKEIKMGDWGYGTLYLRLYAKFDANNKIVLQSRVYNNGTVCYSYNCYATIQDSSIISNEYLSFTSKKEIILGTKTINAQALTAKATFRCYGLGLSNTFTVSAAVTLPADKATGLDFDIGSATIITITRYNESYTRTVVASIGTYSEILLEKGTDTQITWQPEASNLYEQVPNTNIGTITLTTTTYDGDTVIGTQTSTLKCRVTESNPIIDSVIITDSAGFSDNGLVRYKSIPQFTITATPQNGATIASYSVTEQNSTEQTSTSNVIVFQNAVINNSFVIKVIDSRGNSTTQTVSADNFIEYVIPAISKLDLVRTGENLDQIQASISGVWYKGKLQNDWDNGAGLRYRYKTSDGQYSGYETISGNISDSPFTIDTTLSPTGGFDTNSVYTIEVQLIDFFGIVYPVEGEGTLTAQIGKAIPLTDHWNDGTKDYYNINAEIQQNGLPLFGDQKVLWEGEIYMKGDQTANLSEKITEQKNGIVLIWSHYDSGTKNEGFTFFFIPKEYIKITNSTGYGINCTMAHYRFNVVVNKYIYVHDDRIIGNDINNGTGTTNGITYANNRMVLRYVIGV